MKKLFITLIVVCFAGAVFGDMDYSAQRLKMVNEQLIARDINDERVLDVMGLVERHRFVPGAMQAFAYDDMVIGISETEVLARPYSIALTAQLLKLQGDEKILEVGTGPGYETAILAELAKEVYTIGSSEALRIKAEEKLTAMGYNNIRIKTGNADQGWPEYAPYDRVVINDPILYIPQKLIDQLEVGGKLLIHIGDKDSAKSLLVEKQTDSKLKKCAFTGTFFGPILGEKPEEGASYGGKVADENKKWKTAPGSKWKTKQ